MNFYKVNTEEEYELASVFGIQSIPSLLFIQKDRKPMMSVGALPKDSLKQIIDKELLSNQDSDVRQSQLHNNERVSHSQDRVN